MYTHKVGKKTVNLSYVKLVIEIGNARHEGKERVQTAFDAREGVRDI